MITLHYHPGNASLTPHMLLEEIGAPFELAFVDRDRGALRSPEFLALNPNGKIPVLVDGDATGAAQVKAHAEAQIGAMLDTVDAELASHGKSWLLGDTFSAVDPYLLMLGRWTRSFARPARSLPNVGPYLQRVLARPAVQRAFATEKLQPPLV